MTVDSKAIFRELGTWVAEQIGLDPMNVLSVDLHLSGRGMAHVDVRMIVPDSEYGGKLVEQLRRYKLEVIVGDNGEGE